MIHIIKFDTKTLICDNQTYEYQHFISKNHESQILSNIGDVLANWFSSEDYYSFKTSGSTGEPKMIHHLKKDMLSSAKITNSYFNLDLNDTWLLSLPSQFIAGAMMIIRCLSAKGTLIVTDCSSMPAIPADKSISFAAMIPLQIENLIQAEVDLSNIQKLIIGGAAVSRDLNMKLQKLDTNCFATYGMTETITHIAVQALNGKNKSDWFSALDGVKLGVDDESCLSIETNHLSIEKLQTNDIVNLQDNRFQFVGRRDNIINSGGLKISPEAIENQLDGLFDFKLFCFGIDSDKYGKELVLAVESNQLNELEIIEKCRAIIPKNKCPKQVFNINPFVYTTTGKIDRKATIASIQKKRSDI